MLIQRFKINAYQIRQKRKVLNLHIYFIVPTLKMEKRYFDINIKIMDSYVGVGRRQKCGEEFVIKKMLKRGFEMKLSMGDYDYLQLLLLSECDRMQLQKITKYLAKCYFDTSVVCLSLTITNAFLYLLSSILLAIKFNESHTLSDRYSINDLIIITQGTFQHAEFLHAEREILIALNYKLALNSPYHVGQDFMALAKKYPNFKTRLSRLQITIDFAITLPSLALVPPELLFAGCFLNVFDDIVGESDREIIMELIDNREMVREIQKQVESKVSEMGKSQAALEI